VAPHRRGRTGRHRVGEASASREGSADPPLASQEILSTRDHPYYSVSRKNWVDADALKPGELLRASDGSLLEVVKVKWWAEKAKTYNFEVEDWHTYFVSAKAGDSAVWVHNQGIEGYQDHHIISDKNPMTKNHPLLKKAGFDLQSRANKIFLPTSEGIHPRRSIHVGRHRSHLSRLMQRRMDKILRHGERIGANRAWHNRELRKMISKERQMLRGGYRTLNKNHRWWSFPWRKTHWKRRGRGC
tara:strand:- start:782 stop:1510 length:729 start_codon:yes stop_codon:yes gene_type:complete